MALSSSIPVAGSELWLVRDGVPAAVIELDPRAGETERLAAIELQETLKLISGSKLEIVDKATDQETLAIILGSAEASTLDQGVLTAKFTDDLAALAGSDGFAVRTVDRRIYIIAEQPKGVLNGVYSFLEQNTGIVWYRPDPELGPAYRPQSTIRVVESDYLERPAFPVRGWHLTSVWRHSHPATETWMARNRLNFKLLAWAGIDRHLPPLQELGINSYLGGHNLMRWLPPDHYFSSHPEFYGMHRGQRQVRGHQLCFSNREMTIEYARRVQDFMAQSPAGIGYYGIFLEDTWNSCQCPECVKPIRLADGELVDSDHEAFRSTQFFIFLNQVAEAVATRFPDKKLMTLAYFQTSTAPRVPVRDNIHIIFAPHVRCDKHSMTSSECSINPRWAKRFAGWAEATDNLKIYEYFGCATRFPRPQAETVARDLRHYLKAGVRGIHPEGPPDLYREGEEAPLSLSWDNSSLQFWLLTKLFWDPEADLEGLKEQYFKAVYGEAAEPMRELSDWLEQAWNRHPGCEKYYSQLDVAGMATRYLVAPGYREKFGERLETALRLAECPLVRQRIERVVAAYHRWLDELAQAPYLEVLVPAISRDLATSLDHDFTGSAWEQAATIDGFDKMRSPGLEASHKTVIKLLHDHDSLYLGIECFDPDIEHAGGQWLEGSERFPDGDKIELFLDGDKAGESRYYHLVFNIAGTRYDAVGLDSSWRGEWEVELDKTESSWRALVTIPMATIGVDPVTGNLLQGLFYRHYHPHDREHGEHSSWGGGYVHTFSEFGRIVLEK